MQPATSHPVIDKPCTDRLRENRSRRRRISRATAGRVARLLERYENGEQTGFLPLIPTSSIARNYGSKMSTKGWAVQALH